MARDITPADIRFTNKVQIRSDGCMEWTGSKSSTGYGTFYAGKGRSVMAHRWAYEDANGAIPGGLRLDHLCRNRSCVNPTHLEPVTQRENLLRAATVPAKNLLKTHCPAGHPYSDENTYVPPGTSSRKCRTCTYNNNRAQRLKKAA